MYTASQKFAARANSISNNMEGKFEPLTMARCTRRLGTDQNPEDIPRWIFGPDGVRILLSTKSAACIKAMKLPREAAHREIHYKRGRPCGEYRKISPTKPHP